MFTRMLMLAVAAAAAFAVTEPAQAVVIDTDRPKLTGTGYDFGDRALVGGSPTNGGHLEWKLKDGKIRPHLTGTLHIKDADGTCARIKLNYRDKSNDPVTDPVHSPTQCVDDDRRHDYSIDLHSYAGATIDDVKVTLQKKVASGWSTVESDVFTFETRNDRLKITEDGVDFGDFNFQLTGPLGSGDVVWGLDGVVVTPRVRGALHLNNSSGVCARVNVRYYSGGRFLTARAEGEHCADDNGHEAWGVDFRPYSSDRITRVKVQLQTQGSNGSWNVAGSRTVSIAE